MKCQPQLQKRPQARQRHPKTFILLVIFIFTIAASIVVTIFVNPPVENTDSPIENIYDEVIAYDFSAGRNSNLEAKIKDTVEKSSVTKDNDAEVHNVALKAKTIYYFNITKYHTAISALQELEKYASDFEDYVFISELYAKTYNLLGNSKLAAYYQEEYDNLTRTCDTAGSSTDDVATSAATNSAE